MHSLRNVSNAEKKDGEDKMKENNMTKFKLYVVIMLAIVTSYALGISTGLLIARYLP